MRPWECDLQTIAMNMSVHFTILSTVFVACSWEQARLGEGCCMWRLQLMCCIAILLLATHSHTQLSFLSIPLIIPRIWLLICWLMHKECCFQWYNWNFWFSRATRFISTQILFLELCPWEHCWYCTFHKHLSMTLWIYKQPLYYLLHIPYNKKLS